jgi:hypothetical protein
MSPGCGTPDIYSPAVGHEQMSIYLSQGVFDSDHTEMEIAGEENRRIRARIADGDPSYFAGERDKPQKRFKNVPKKINQKTHTRLKVFLRSLPQNFLRHSNGMKQPENPDVQASL